MFGESKRDHKVHQSKPTYPERWIPSEDGRTVLGVELSFPNAQQPTPVTDARGFSNHTAAQLQDMGFKEMYGGGELLVIPNKVPRGRPKGTAPAQKPPAPLKPPSKRCQNTPPNRPATRDDPLLSVKGSSSLQY